LSLRSHDTFQLPRSNTMRRTSTLAAAVLCAGLILQVGTAAAMDDMKKDTMGKDAHAMKKGAMAADCPDRGAMGKEAMASEGMKKDSMGHDAMAAKDTMKKGAAGKDCMPDTMKKDGMAKDGMAKDGTGHDAMKK